MPDTTRNKAKWNRTNYYTFLVRVRHGSDLHDHIAAHKLDGQSLNSLVCFLLADYFRVGVPLKRYISRRTVHRFRLGGDENEI